MLKSIILAVALLSMSLPALSESYFDHRRVFSQLGNALDKYDQIELLPESKWLGRDQQSTTSDMYKIIDSVVRSMDSADMLKLRQDYRRIERLIEAERQRIVDLRERRQFAPATDATTLTRYTPTQTLRTMTASTRGDYDMLIEARQENITAYREDLSRIRTEMASHLEAIGISLNPDQVELWLSSVIGDDVMSMSIVFNSIKEVTIQLEELTRESGENLTNAKRYYGMIIILHKLVVRMQEDFIANVDSAIIPKLNEYMDEANSIIADSRRQISEGGRREVLENNIAQNEFTKQAIQLYTRIIKSQRDKVANALTISKREEAVAINTYRTVRLSSAVVEQIRDGVRTFETLSNLQLPDATEFSNNEMREEFRKLTDRLNTGN